MVVYIHISNNNVQYHSMFKSLTTIIPSSHETVRCNFNYVYEHTIQNIFKLARKNNLTLKLLKKLFQFLNCFSSSNYAVQTAKSYTAD